MVALSLDNWSEAKRLAMMKLEAFRGFAGVQNWLDLHCRVLRLEKRDRPTKPEVGEWLEKFRKKGQAVVVRLEGTAEVGCSVHHCIAIDGKHERILDCYDQYQLTMSVSALESCVGNIDEFLKVREIVVHKLGKRTHKCRNKARKKRKKHEAYRKRLELENKE